MRKAYVLSIAAVLAATAASASAQSRIWRCGNTYTNDPNEAQARFCRIVDNTNVTVIEGSRVYQQPQQQAAQREVKVTVAPQAVSAPPAAAARIDANEQKARDAEARAILEAELQKAEARLAELLKEYNNGEPEKLGPETRNHQKYLDRVAELKASIARTESDIAGLKRELGRK